MRDIRDCSGPWAGIWTQRTVRGTMHGFRLEFQGDVISGEGTDRDGPFVMRGKTDGEAVHLVKAYPWLIVRYNGRWNGAFVAGTSTIGPVQQGERGTFEMWPEDEEAAVTETEAERREPVVA